MLRVSLFNLNLIAGDAIGMCIIHQARFLRRRGDAVKIFVLHPPAADVPKDIVDVTQVVTLADVLARRDSHLAQSDLYVYHYPQRHALMESMRGVERGTVVFYYHNVTPPALWGSTFEREQLQHSRDSVAQFATYADWVVTDSSFNAQELVQVHGCMPERVRILPLAVPLNDFFPSAANPALLRQYKLDGKTVILFIGRMAGNKRIDQLVRAMPSVLQRIPAAVLLLVGDDRSNPAIQDTVTQAQRLATELGVAEAVIFTGAVASVTPYFHLAHVYASASQHEGFGVPLIEAMACGVPVVASAVAAHPEVIGEAGMLFDNVEELVQHLVHVLSDPAWSHELAQRGLARAQEFSLERFESHWAEIVAEATAWLPNQLLRRLPPPAIQAPPPPQISESLAPQAPAGLTQELNQLRALSDVMNRSFQPRSGLPVLGRFVTWLRRNLTFHVREMYLDPTLERQVAFNRQTSRVLQALVEQTQATSSLLKNTSESDGHIARAETWLNLISAQLTLLQTTQPSDISEQLSGIFQEVRTVHKSLSALAASSTTVKDP